LEATKVEVAKPSKKAKKPEATLDLFAAFDADAASRMDTEGMPKDELTPQESLEGRLVSYLLNPEVAYNPAQPIQLETLKADSALWDLYNEVELPLAEVLREVEKEGVRIDVQMLQRSEEQLSKELATLEQAIYTAAGVTFNVNSPKQVGEVLFDQLKLDTKAKKSKTGQYSTSEEVLLGLKGKHEVVAMILEYRELKKLISTYIAALPTYINPETGKIHTTYNQTVTATGRLSSSNPNLQNLPIRSERGQLIRQAVIPDEGCLFLSADYSQIELRLMAHFSQDPHMVEAFRSGQDVHAATAAKIFGVAIEEVTKEQRRQAKTANFGIIYGISAFGLAQQLDCSRSEAKALIDGYFAAFPGVIDYIERQKELARQQGYAITLFGRKRYLPDINSHNATVRSFAERNAVNSPIQGTAADIIKKAMVAINRRLKVEGLQAKMIMQVHDELNFNVPVNEVDRVKELVVSEMQNVVQLSVPLIADCGVGKNWLEAH
jgi:DNA polymerase-1